MYKQYDVLDPSSVGELTQRLNETDSRTMSRLALRLIVLQEPDELEARRSSRERSIEVTLNVEMLTVGVSPYLIGTVDNDPTRAGRLEPVNPTAGEHIPDKERTLVLSVFEQE